MHRQAYIFVAIALACAGCLVTNELEFEANQNRSVLERLAPRDEISWGPSVADPRCGNPPAIAFEADYLDDDVEQLLYIRPLVNGENLSSSGLPRALPDPAGSPRHIPEGPICVPRSAFNRNCNVVQLLVGSDAEYGRLISPTPPYGDPEIASLTWYVGPLAMDTETTPARPYISFSECFAPDGGL